MAHYVFTANALDHCSLQESSESCVNRVTSQTWTKVLWITKIIIVCL